MAIANRTSIANFKYIYYLRKVKLVDYPIIKELDFRYH